MLSRYFGVQRWYTLVLVVIGLAAAFADQLGVILAVILLFALLQKGGSIEASMGLADQIPNGIAAFLEGSTAWIALLLFLVVLVNACLIYLNNLLTGTMLNVVAKRMRDLIHKTYINVSYHDIQSREHGELINTIATESWNVSDVFYSVTRIWVNLCSLTVFGVVIFNMSWILGTTAVVGFGLAAGLLRLLSGPIRRLSQETLEVNQTLADRMLASLAGMRTIRLFARQNHMLRVFEGVSDRVAKLCIRREVLQALMKPMSQVASLSVLVLIAVVADHSGIETSKMIATVMLLLRVQPYISEIETHRLALAGMSASISDVRRMLDKEGKTWPDDGVHHFKQLNTAVEFHDVSFSHKTDEKLCLSNVSFTIRKGDITVIKGASGSGKSTILNLLMRLYEPDTGHIQVDDQKLADLTRESWLSNVAIAGQDITLIEGTVRENMYFGRPTATMDEIRAACEITEILGDIDALPDGFDTKIGATGLSFSGGQRQRITLACALLRNPDILILDEAMSAIEPSREDRIFRRVSDMMDGKTIIAVSHRSNLGPSMHNITSIELKQNA